MSNKNLHKAKEAKNDEFYTHYSTIDAELFNYDLSQFRDKVVLCPCDDPVESNFTLFFIKNFNHLGLRKLISTGYKKDGHGKKYVLEGDINGDGVINQKDIVTEDLEGDGNFNSDEIKALRDDADIICTNPPFSLFRDFLAWINPDEKKFLILGNMNAITYKEVFPLIRDNKLWLGASIHSGDVPFYIPDHYVASESIKVDEDNKRYVRVPGVRWFTNLNHRGRTEELQLLTKAVREQQGVVYQKYDNYDAIEVPETKLIPSDYDGVMGVPISFLDKYNPDQFEIVGFAGGNSWANYRDTLISLNYRQDIPSRGGGAVLSNKLLYGRLLIKNK